LNGQREERGLPNVKNVIVGGIITGGRRKERESGAPNTPVHKVRTLPVWKGNQ